MRAVEANPSMADGHLGAELQTLREKAERQNVMNQPSQDPEDTWPEIIGTGICVFILLWLMLCL